MNGASTLSSELEGGLDIAIEAGGDVSIGSKRPVHAARILRGKTAEQALEMIPLMFSICSMAQSITARHALNAACSDKQFPASLPEQTLLIPVETARESLLWLLRDVPALLSLPGTDPAAMGYAGQLLPTFKNALAAPTSKPDQINELITELDDFLREQIFGVDCDRFLTFREASIQDWMRGTATTAAAVTRIICDQGWASQGYNRSGCTASPAPDLEQLADKLRGTDAGAFIQYPSWRGECLETGSFARQGKHPLMQELQREFGNGLISRWFARLLDLAGIPDLLRRSLAGEALDICHSQAVGTHCGIASTEAARGRLVHFADVRDGVINDYRVLAPTEWNFHPRGSAARSLGGIRVHSREERHQLAHLLIHTIDPCVGYELRVA